MKVTVFGAHSLLVDEATVQEAERRKPSDPDSLVTLSTRDEAIRQEIADNIAELLSQPIPVMDMGGEDEQQG